MFLDEVVLSVSAGHGGPGSNSLRREKFVPKGGPDGGDGGRGGDVLIRSRLGLSSLQGFHLERTFRAKPGRPGEGSKRHGADGESVVLAVPCGTMIFEAGDGQLLADLDGPEQQVVVARGGRGGKGNFHFATATYQAPTRRELGEPGEERQIRLELRLIADIGLVGLPNAGKSTLLATLTGAHPRIADYPFTTLSPNLGVAELPSGQTVTAADVPGLIEGAHRGAGLGVGFLRHLGRTRLLVHVVDAGLGTIGVLAAYGQVAEELRLHSQELALKPAVVALNKIDLLSPQALAEAESALVSELGPEVPVVSISASTGAGTESLLQECSKLLARRSGRSPEPGRFQLYRGPQARDRTFRVIRDDGVISVDGASVARLVRLTDMADDAAVMRLQNQLLKLGVEEALTKAGVEAGSEVVIAGQVFTFFPEMRADPVAERA